VCMCEDWDGVTRGGGYFGLFGSVLGRGGSGRKVGMNGGVPGSDRLWMLFADVCGNGGSWARGDRRRETGEAIGNCVSWCVYSRFGNNGGLARCSVQYYGCLSLSYFREFVSGWEWSTYTQETQTLKWQNYCEIQQGCVSDRCFGPSALPVLSKASYF
jgi:hypothetical protein